MEHDTIDISTSQIKSVAPFPPVIIDLISGWSVLDHNLDSMLNLSIQECDNEFKSTGPQFAIGNSISHMLHNNNMGGILFNLKWV